MTHALDIPEERCVVTIHYLDGEVDEIPFGSKPIAQQFLQRTRKRKDIISVTLSESQRKH
ncbi:MAG TPA: hypothetical protein VHQ01_03135 [Pyrinomonadaceae bacterium]|jgi:hypothetical protein|nr:hypothetical protein [Pyrinomonadaceae bacterium]